MRRAGRGSSMRRARGGESARQVTAPRLGFGRQVARGEVPHPLRGPSSSGSPPARPGVAGVVVGLVEGEEGAVSQVRDSRRVPTAVHGVDWVAGEERALQGPVGEGVGRRVDALRGKIEGGRFKLAAGPGHEPTHAPPTQRPRTFISLNTTPLNVRCGSPSDDSDGVASKCQPSCLRISGPFSGSAT